MYIIETGNMYLALKTDFERISTGTCTSQKELKYINVHSYIS